MLDSFIKVVNCKCRLISNCLIASLAIIWSNAYCKAYCNVAQTESIMYLHFVFKNLSLDGRAISSQATQFSQNNLPSLHSRFSSAPFPSMLRLPVFEIVQTWNLENPRLEKTYLYPQRIYRGFSDLKSKIWTCSYVPAWTLEFREFHKTSQLVFEGRGLPGQLTTVLRPWWDVRNCCIFKIEFLQILMLRKPKNMSLWIWWNSGLWDAQQQQLGGQSHVWAMGTADFNVLKNIILG